MGWISVEDKLPQDNTHVFITQHEYDDKERPRYYDVCLFIDGGWFDDNVEDAEKVYEPTHWMPLPEPPK